MSGDLRVEEHMDAMGRVIPPRKHDRAALVLDENLRLSFEDTRKFGRIWLVQDVDEVVGRLGPEPLNPEFTPEIFYQHLLSFKRQLKPLLLDQTFLAGMGNIYTDEALHRAHLHPLLKADMLSEMQAAELLWAIRYVLLKGIETNGASIDWVYRGGSFQNTFQVYGRSKQACYTCGHSIEKISVGQRGTHFCPYCQPYKISQDL
jgi:formamidopyrimidine-DNA glycosylase